MHTFSYAPPVALREVVDRFWGWQSRKSEALSLVPIMPGAGGIEIFFHFEAPFSVRNPLTGAHAPLSTAYVSCLRNRPFHIEKSGELDFLAVRIRSAMAPLIMPMPVTELAENFVSLDDVWGVQARDLLDSLQPLDTQRRIDAISSFLISKIRRPRHHQAILCVAHRLEHHAASIAELAREARLGQRNLQIIFKQHVGVGPARYRRLARFRRSIKSLLLSRKGAKSILATLDDGYYDQAQQIREFQEFSGLTPGQVIRMGSTGYHFFHPTRC